jgi:protein pelota
MEEGIAHIFAISQQKTLLKAKIEKSIQKNKGAASAAKAASSKNAFFNQVISALETHFSGENSSKFERVGCIVVGSPGFVKDNFYTYLKDYSSRKQSEFLKQVESKVVLAHCSSGYKHSLKEIMSNQEVM